MYDYGLKKCAVVNGYREPAVVC